MLGSARSAAMVSCRGCFLACSAAKHMLQYQASTTEKTGNNASTLDARRNEPNVHLVEELPNLQRWRGAELSVTILGNWQYYRAKIHRQGLDPCASG